MNNFAIARSAREIATRALRGVTVTDVNAHDVADEDGEAAIDVEIVVDRFDQSVFVGKRAQITRELLVELAVAGDNRYPFVHFATLDEVAAIDD